MLLLGFALFQGVFWPGWWILLMSFLPWERLGVTRVRSAAGERVPRDHSLALTPAQAAFALLIVGQQAAMSAFHVEARPLFSAYDMYSATYGSPQEYEDAINLTYRIVLYEGERSREVPDCPVDDRSAALLPAAARGEASARAWLRELVLGCIDAAPARVTAVALEGDREVYNWDTGEFEWKRRLDVIGPVPADWLR